MKVVQAEVNEDIINNYFNELELLFEGIAATHIFNYDETDITDDPGAKHVVVRRARKRVQQKTRHSKSLISVMFAGSAAGKFLPPMVVYKSEISWINLLYN